MAQVAAATYGGDPENSPLDHVRLLVGDTECRDAFLRDSEINFFVANDGNAPRAAVSAAEAIAAKLARKINVRTGAVSKSLGDLMQHFLDLAKTLRAKADEVAGAPVFTALTKSDKLDDRLNEDLVQPQFRIAQDDNPRKVTSRDESVHGLFHIP